MGPAPEADNPFQRSGKNTVSRSHPRRRQTELPASSAVPKAPRIHAPRLFRRSSGNAKPPPPRARLRSGGFPDGWERSAPHSYKTPRTAPEAGTKARRRPTLMRTWGQLPRRTIPSRGPGKTRTAASIPAAARQGSPPFPPSPKRRGQGSRSLPPKFGERETAPLPRKAPVRRLSGRMGTLCAARPAFPGPRRPVFCRLKTKHRKGESGNLLPFGVF